MIETLDIKITQVEQSRLSSVDFDNLSFGKYFSDHMLVADYADGKWQSCEIVPYGDLSFNPATSVFHYGQAIFEGIKAYKFEDGTVSVFRPDRNWERFNKSASRLEMPEIPEDIFIGGLKRLLDLDRGWIPSADGTSL